MIRIRTVQLAAHPGQIRENWKSISAEIAKAEKEKIDVLLFPEMCLTGYLIGDLWDQDAFLRECERYNAEMTASSKGITLVWGSCAVDWNKRGSDGRPRKYNAAFAAYDGHLIIPERSRRPFVTKTLLPNYRQFDDKRYFTGTIELAGEEKKPVSSLIHPVTLPTPEGSIRAGLLLCEDSWDENYGVHPMEILARKGIDIFFNLSASPFTLGKNEKRHRLFAASLSRLQKPLLYVNRRGLENNGKDCYVYDGMTALYNEKGQVQSEAAPYTEERTDFLYDETSHHLTPVRKSSPYEGNMLLPTMRYAVREFLSLIHQDKVVIGISGGIDSAVTAALFRSVLPADHILLVNTPTRFNSAETKNLARKLARNLGSPFLEIPIGSFVDETARALDHLQINTHPPKVLHITSFMKENMQARDRSSRILSALSAEFGGIFTCNANKTELSAGYGTLYGDLSGAIDALGDLWKHQVYELGRLLNEFFGKEMIPAGIFTVKPSAELSENQNISQGLGDPFHYDYHDYLFRSFVEPWHRSTPEDILRWYKEGTLETHIGTPVSVKALFPKASDFIADLERWWNLFAGFSVAKRIQSPPLLAISRRPYGYDLRESQMQPYYTDGYLALKKELLSEEK